MFGQFFTWLWSNFDAYYDRHKAELGGGFLPDDVQ